MTTIPTYSLGAYVAWVADTAAGPAALRQMLAGVLPNCMRPAAIVLLPALSLPANGKIDREALLAPDRRALPSRSFAAPHG